MLRSFPALQYPLPLCKYKESPQQCLRIRIRRIHMCFGPPGFGSVSQKYGSGSFYHQAKIVRKTLIPTVLWLLLDLSLKNGVNVPSKSKKINRKIFLKLNFVGVLKVNDENSRIRIQIRIHKQRHRSATLLPSLKAWKNFVHMKRRSQVFRLKNSWNKNEVE